MNRILRLLKPLVLASLLVFIMAVSVLFLLNGPLHETAIAEHINADRRYFDVARLLLMASLVTFWGPLIRWRGRQRGLTSNRIEQLAQHRWTLALCLLAVELVLVQPFWEWLP